MGHKPTLGDLMDVHPTIHRSLQKLLTQDNVAQLGLVFQVCQGAHQIVLNPVLPRLHMMLNSTLDLILNPNLSLVSCAEPEHL